MSIAIWRRYVGKFKKYILEAIKDELELLGTVSSLLQQLTHRYVAEQKKLFRKKNAKNDKEYQNILSKSEIGQLIDQIFKRFPFAIPHIKVPNQPHLSDEQNLIINWDFEGINLHKKSLNLSTYFKNALETSKRYDVAHRHEANEYNLDQIPIWNEMKKFKNFRDMYHPLKHQLAEMGYDPTQLNLLNICDVGYLIKKHNKENPKNQMQCQRTRFLKMFSACYGDEFIQKSRMLGREEVAKDFIEYIDCLGTDKKVSDERWKELLQASSYFSVHHKKNRQYAFELDDYSKINDFSNLALCFHHPYHTVLHQPQVMDLNTNIVYFGSFRPEFQIIRDPERERQYLKGNLLINPRGKGKNG